MATKPKKGKGRVKARSKDPKHKTIKTFAVKPHRYSITYNTGHPAKYEDPEDMARMVDEYFEYIKGEEGEREILIGKKKVKQQYWIREPEPATVTGLTLFLGFESTTSLADYAKRGPEFARIINRGKLRVENRYEKNLSSDKCTGSIFALKNMGWKDANFLPTEGEGGTIIGFQYVVPKKPKEDAEE